MSAAMQGLSTMAASTAAAALVAAASAVQPPFCTEAWCSCADFVAGWDPDTNAANGTCTLATDPDDTWDYINVAGGYPQAGRPSAGLDACSTITPSLPHLLPRPPSSSSSPPHQR